MCSMDVKMNRNDSDSWIPVGALMEGQSAVFNINGNIYKVSDLPTSTTLITFIREHAHLRGTKFMCLEGGCGACIVNATIKLPNGKTSSFAVNSCLIPIYACHGWSIETVESLGNRKNGFGKVQSVLASHNGTQCGYCSPGMVMNMYSLLKSNKEITMKEVENSFGGNICRCTGYRPILDAFKSLARDAPKELKEKCIDLEELSKVCQKSNKKCSTVCSQTCIDIDLFEKQLHLRLSDGTNWYRVSEKKEIFEIFGMIEDYTYMLVAGRTSHGVYRIKNIKNYIDINGVAELSSLQVTGDSLILGANVSLTNAMKFFYGTAKQYQSKFWYAKILADHIDLIANVPVRNVGTLAGNLLMKHKHRDFPSDIFLILEGVGAQLTIDDNFGIQRVVPLMEFLAMDMNKKVISKITMPSIDSSYVFNSYKIMPRAQNAHAYVNAAFLLKVNKKDKFKVLEKPNIIFGGITNQFVHANNTETLLNGKCLLDNSVLQQALKSLSSEIKPDYIPPEASPEYKKGLAISLFYKFILSLSPDAVSTKNKSGGEKLVRPISSGKQDFDTDKNVWPLNKPIPKLEAYNQCSGEAEFVNDIKPHPGELFCGVVLSKKATASMFKLDPSEALKIPGVVAFYSAKDIPGDNDFMSPKIVPEMKFIGEEIFATKDIKFAGQALGVIVANTHALALEAAEKVKVEYSGVKKPIIDFIEVFKSGLKDRIVEIAKIEPKQWKDDTDGHKIIGESAIKGQYHFTMETQTCLCVPTENGLDIYPSSQWPSLIQGTISNVLKISENSINVSVRRLGGAYGCKITRNNQVAAICALASYLTNKPVRLTLSLETNMQMIGKRFPCYIKYEIDVDDNGKIEKLNADIYQDVGATFNEAMNTAGTIEFLKNTYDTKTWSVVGYAVRTDTPSNTWARAPGSTEAAFCAETLMEHIAKVVKKDSLLVKLANTVNVQNPIVQLMNDLKSSSDYEKRLSDIKSFNLANRWKKQGISFCPLNYPVSYYGRYHATVSVFGNDGTVSISHGGVECGQGLNTKAAQVCAHILEIPLELINVIPTLNFISPNNSTTGGSITSESVAYAVLQACEEIKKRIEPVKKSLPAGSSWVDIIRNAASTNVDLKASVMYKQGDVNEYNVYAACVTEVEVDILTGQTEIKRVDILEDTGKSLSPEIDVGQIEGAFVMGLGYYMNEHLVYEPNTGKLLNDRSWNYKPPGAKDIPVDFRVTLLHNSNNPFGVLRSKATGEPPLNLSCSVISAIRNAVESARNDAGNSETWFDFDYPVTPEETWLKGLTDIKSMTL